MSIQTSYKGLWPVAFSSQETKQEVIENKGYFLTTTKNVEVTTVANKFLGVTYSKNKPISKVIKTSTSITFFNSIAALVSSLYHKIFG